VRCFGRCGCTWSDHGEVTMSSKSIHLLVLAALAGAGCQDEAQGCPEVMGMYLATYTYADGNCALMQGTAGPFDMTSERATATLMQMRTDDMIITEVTKRGCDVRVNRSASKEGNTLWLMEGQLDVESSDTLSGPMRRFEWQDGVQVCAGTYNTVMQKMVEPPAPPPIATF
jgi:hypothetical protein